MIDAPEPVKAVQRAVRTGIGRGLFVIISAAIVSAIFAHHSVLHQVERWTFDTLAKLDPPSPRGVVVVDIDDRAYEDQFDASSPLDPAALYRLIDAIAKGRPKVIGVDIDTSSRRFASFKVDSTWPPLIWARATRPVNAGDDLATTVRSGDYALIVSSALGRSDSQTLAHSAIPIVLADDTDRRVRRYQQIITVGADRSPAFARLVAERSGRPLSAASEPARIIRYGPSDTRLRIRASDALALRATDGWQSVSGPLYGKIVLLGGSYAGQDRHATPLGEMKGVDILANVVETELEGGGPTHPGWFRVFMIQIFGAVFVALLLHIVRSKSVAFAIFALALAILAPLSSLLAYGTFDRWLYFGLVYAAAAGSHVADNIKMHMSHRQQSAVTGAYEELRGRVGAFRHRTVADAVTKSAAVLTPDTAATTAGSGKLTSASLSVQLPSQTERRGDASKA